MNASELKVNILKNDPENHFFDRKTMKFFDDTMANYGVRAVTVKSNWDDFGQWIEEPVTVQAWKLYRKRAVKHGLKTSHYFRQSNFSRLHPID